MCKRRYAVFLALLTVVLGEERQIFDVTTIFEVDKTDLRGHVHSRTNALGLSLYNGSGEVQHKTMATNITCDSEAQVCNWDTKDWIKSERMFWKMAVARKVYEMTATHPIQLSFKKKPKIGDENFLVLTKYNSDMLSKRFYVIQFTTGISETDVTFFSDCFTENNYNRYSYQVRFLHYDGSTINASCERKDNLTSVSINDTLEIEFVCCNYLRIQKNSKYISDYSGNANNYYFMSGLNFYRFQPLVWVPVTMYSSEPKSSEMVSPAISANLTNICLVIVFENPSELNPGFESTTIRNEDDEDYTSYDSIDERPVDIMFADRIRNGEKTNHKIPSNVVFEILAEDLFSNRQHLQFLYYEQSNWSIKRLNLTLPKTMHRPIKLVVKKPHSYIVNIIRIASCNQEGEEVEILQGSQYNNGHHQTDLSSFISSGNRHMIFSDPAEIEYKTSTCLNGGVPTVIGCACPPGFYGDQCQTGCGRNRYGQDCGGLCSVLEKECEGLMMCTEYTGCQCAPGYQGNKCNEKCSAGWYGNNCSQPCGHCHREPSTINTCDIYTGECNRCMFGYLPPYCKDESVYYTSKPELKVTEYGVIQVKFNPENFNAKHGTPELYQIQYREKINGESDWKTYITKKIPKANLGAVKEALLSENIEGLKDGAVYQVRVLFMDSSFNKYDGHLVQVSEIISKCDIPDEIDYNVKVDQQIKSLTFTWSYDNKTEHWCPVQGYEVLWKGSWEWFTNNTISNVFLLEKLLPGSKVYFKVRAKTSGGFAPFSELLAASTIKEEPSTVRNLNIEASKSTSVEISWDPPRDSENLELEYKVFYKCIDRPACSSGCQNISEGQSTTRGRRITLRPLTPFTQYLVTVAPRNGQNVSIYVGTSEDVPTEVPVLSDRHPVTTNTSITVFWNHPPEVCSSYLLGYNYQLLNEQDPVKVLDRGFTKHTSTSFYNLTASTQYNVRVFVSTIAGYNPDSFLDIKLSTTATVPDAVRNLTVYKRGKGMLGLRWAAPRNVYGTLKSFTVTHTLGQNVTSHTIEPSHCVVWPELYCHTIEGLKSNRKYNVTVSARNIDVGEDGQGTSVTGITKESPPSVPTNLKLVNSSTSSLRLQWQYPELANGIVRSFLVSVEEMESYDQESCCQVYPLVETVVKEELPTYETEVSGLHPASTYFVSVSAKTVGMGPSQSLVVYTRPPHLPLLDTSLPRVDIPQDLTWLPQQPQADVNNSNIYSPLVKAHLLLAIQIDTEPQVGYQSGVSNSSLDRLLKQAIGRPFLFIADYNKEGAVYISGPIEDRNSDWGHPPLSLAENQRYQLIAAQVSEYNGVYNADLRYSQPFNLII